MTNVLLSDLVLSLKRQLHELATRQRDDDEVVLSLREVEVELVVQASSSTTSKGGVEFWVISGERGGERATGHTQRITLKLASPKELELGD